MYKQIHDALRARYKLLTDHELAFSNISYSPTDSVLYLCEYFLPSMPISTGIDYDTEDIYRGIFQINIYAPINGGMGDTDSAYEAIAALFAKGTDLGNGLFITKIVREQSLTANNRYTTPVSIYFEAIG